MTAEAQDTLVLNVIFDLLEASPRDTVPDREDVVEASAKQGLTPEQVDESVEILEGQYKIKLMRTFEGWAVFSILPQAALELYAARGTDVEGERRRVLTAIDKGEPIESDRPTEAILQDCLDRRMVNGPIIAPSLTALGTRWLRA